MKRIVCFVLVLVIGLSICTMGLGEDFPGYGAYYPSITKEFSKGQGNEKAFWTQDSTHLSLLAILLEEDMKRQDYEGFNVCFPNSSLSCILYNTGRQEEDSIKVIFYGDGYVTADYMLDMDTVFYSIDQSGLFQDMDQFKKYVSQTGGQHFSHLWYTFESYGFNEPNAAYLDAMKMWQSYYDRHPELIDNSHIGW